VSKVRDTGELEEILPESSTQLVSLNTRVPRFVSKMIDESVGILQLASRYHKVSKQVAIQILIEEGYRAIREEFESMDRVESEIAVSSSVEEYSEESTSEQVVSEPKESILQRSFDMKAYAEMANKTYYNGPERRTKKEPSESAKRLQSKLGLR
jgi:hypothetical protein